jgi:hypothetical protein
MSDLEPDPEFLGIEFILPPILLKSENKQDQVEEEISKTIGIINEEI